MLCADGLEEVIVPNNAHHRDFSVLNNAHHHTDYIVVGSDSGRIVILEYNPQKNNFNKVRANKLYSTVLCVDMHAKVVLPYSGEFHMVQTFAELLVSPLEEIFMVLILCL